MSSTLTLSIDVIYPLIIINKLSLTPSVYINQQLPLIERCDRQQVLQRDAAEIRRRGEAP